MGTVEVPAVSAAGRDVWADGAVNLAGAAAFTGLGRTTLYELMDSGRLANARVNGRRLIARRSLVELLASSGAER
jgi:hypothetical protein